MSLSSLEQFDDPSIQRFISSTIEMPEPGVIHYDPTTSQEKWCVSYIRHQESQTFEFRDSYTVEVSAVGQYQIDPGDIKHHVIAPKDYSKRHEVEVCTQYCTTKDMITAIFLIL